MYKVFSDQHHLSLYNSLSILFEKRLGGTLYRPIGKDWFTRGYWRMAEIYNNHPETIEQYLGIRPDYIPADGSAPLNRVQKIEKGVYYIWDPEYEYYHKAIELNTFMQTDIDIVIASIPQHITSFARLCAEHPKHPKLIYQVGNAWTIQEGYAKNIMASAIINSVPPETNIVTYHQEFDTTIFSPTPPVENKNINSFINCLNTASHYQFDWDLFQKVEKIMPEWSFKSFGGSCRDGAAHGAVNLATLMKASRFIWHTKNGGDGYGHIIHNAGAVGRPMIVKRQYYEGKMGKDLMKDGVTCVTVDGLNLNEIVNKINYYNEENRYQTLCKEAYNNFMSVVNFDKEAEQIKTFLANLK